MKKGKELLSNYNSYYIISILVILFIISCRTKTDDNKKINQTNGNNIVKNNKDTNKLKNNFIIKIAFAKGGCEGTCPMESYQIDSSLNVFYYGGIYARKKGFYVGRIDKETWDLIVQKVDSFSPNRLQDKYNKGYDDLSMQIVFCYYNKKKSIEGQSHELPQDFKELFYWLDSKLRKVKLTNTNKILDFETTYQHSDRNKR